MLQPMQPSMEPQPRVTVATAETEVETEPDVNGAFQTDELIINSKKVPVLQKHLERIEENYNVQVGLGMRAVEGEEMQWISIQGLPEDRTMAKSYIKALCSPGNTLSFNFPDELHKTLSQCNVHARLERQSNTAILFPAVGKAIIQGEDDLAVTLAMSAIEDIIQKYNDVNIPDLSSPTATGEASNRLDRELRRLSNQNKEMYGDEFDMEMLTSLPAAVKRTLVKQYMDDSRQNSIDDQKSEITYSQDPDQTVPMKLVGTESVSSCAGFVDLHPEKRSSEKSKSSTSLEKPSTVVDLHPVSDSDSLSLSLHLSARMDTQAAEIMELRENDKPTPPTQQRASPVGASASSQEDNKKSAAVPLIDLTVDSPVRPQPTTTSLVTEAIKFALNSGYSREEIDEVHKDYGELLTTAQFLQVLHTNRREKTQKHAVTVSELEAAHVPRPPKIKEDDEEADGGEENERPVTPSGKQQAPQGHNQGPKTKKGKLSKATPTKQTAKPKSRRNRRSPTEENTEKMEIVNLSDEETETTEAQASALPKPLQAILQHSPHARKKPGKEGEENSPVLMDYLKRLTQDYDEEDSSDIEEVRKRNTVRRAMLEQAMELERIRHCEAQEKSSKNEGDGDNVEETSEGEWLMAERNGRHRFPKSPEKPVGKNSVKGKNASSDSNISKNNKPDGKVVADGAVKVASSTQRRDTETVLLDELDDFSLPPGLNIEDSADGHMNKRGHLQGGLNQLNQTRGQYFKPHHRNQPYNQLGQRHPQQRQYQPPPQQPRPPPLMEQTFPPKANQPKCNLRYIIIDGSNVAMTHGNHQVFSCKGIKICIDYFRRRGHREITAFVPQWRTHAPRPDYPIRDQQMLEELRKDGFLVFTPARRVPGKNIVCYDDKYVLRLAQETEGIIVSNDNYRDLWHEKREWRQIIEQRLLMFSFVGDIFMPPDDPLGRNGPALEVFLQKSNDLFPEQRYGDGTKLQSYNRPNPNGQGPRPIWGRGQQGQYPGRQGQGHLDQGQFQGRQGQGQKDQGQFQGRPGIGPVDYYQGRPIQGQMLRNPNPAATYQGQGYQGQGHPGQDHFAHNLQGQNYPNQNPHDRPQQRPDNTTDWLKKKLFVIFPDKEANIDQVLAKNPGETDINRIIEYMLVDDQ